MQASSARKLATWFCERPGVKCSATADLADQDAPCGRLHARRTRGSDLRTIAGGGLIGPDFCRSSALEPIPRVACGRTRRSRCSCEISYPRLRSCLLFTVADKNNHVTDPGIQVLGEVSGIRSFSALRVSPESLSNSEDDAELLNTSRADRKYSEV